MCVLVAYNSVYLASGKACLVYADMRTDVVRKNKGG